MRKIFYLFTLFVFLFSCNSKKKDANMKELKMSLYSNPDTIDPRKSGDLISSSIIFMMYAGLMQNNNDGKLELGLAKSYEVSEDLKKYTFTIKDDAKWSDGHSITAYDFEKSWKKIMDPNFPAKGPQLFYCIKNAQKIALKDSSIENLAVKAINEKTLVVELENPTPYFLSLTSFCIFFPIPTHIEEKDSNWDKKNFKDIPVVVHLN